jgi:outer membrane receptor protein involved in Fe transport
MQITDAFRLRGTLSRDVRAANLSERFDKTGGAAVVNDPRYPADGSTNITIFSGGNPNVDPEEADTITVGFVYQPSYIEGLSLSVDWYDIDISGAIGQLTSQAVIDRCEEGAEALCSLITRDLTTDRLVLVGSPFINIDQAVVSGIDLEADYRRDITWFGDGQEFLQARLLASYLDENSETLAGTTKIDRAGQTGIQQSDGDAYALPDFKFTANLTYNYGPFSAFIQGRYIGDGKLENALTEGVDIESNEVDSAFYLDLRLGYVHQFSDRSSVEVYATVTNVLDEDPPITPYYSVFLGYAEQYNPRLFDLLGRRYVGGVRIRF